MMGERLNNELRGGITYRMAERYAPILSPIAVVLAAFVGSLFFPAVLGLLILTLLVCIFNVASGKHLDTSYLFISLAALLAVSASSLITTILVIAILCSASYSMCGKFPTTNQEQNTTEVKFGIKFGVKIKLYIPLLAIGVFAIATFVGQLFAPAMLIALLLTLLTSIVSIISSEHDFNASCLTIPFATLLIILAVFSPMLLVLCTCLYFGGYFAYKIFVKKVTPASEASTSMDNSVSLSHTFCSKAMMHYIGSFCIRGAGNNAHHIQQGHNLDSSQ